MAVQVFKAFIGGYFGDSYRVEKDGDLLTYVRMDDGFREIETETLQPTSEQWEAFEVGCRMIGMADWRENYPNPGILDGTQWSVEIETDGFRLRSRGDNAFPHDESCEAADSDGRPFSRFLTAVCELLAGRPFC